jgi:hypothetical protein
VRTSRVIRCLQRLGVLGDGDEVARSLELLEDVGLLAQHQSIALVAVLRKLAPASVVLRVALDAVRLVRVLPMALGEANHGRDLVVLDVVHEAHDGAGLLEPVALPQLTRANALERDRLIVQATSDRAALHEVHDARGREELHLVTPLLRLAVLALGVIVVDQVGSRMSSSSDGCRGVLV